MLRIRPRITRQYNRPALPAADCLIRYTDGGSALVRVCQSDSNGQP